MVIAGEFGAELKLHAIHTTMAANGLVARLLRRQLWGI